MNNLRLKENNLIIQLFKSLRGIVRNKSIYNHSNNSRIVHCLQVRNVSIPFFML